MIIEPMLSRKIMHPLTGRQPKRALIVEDSPIFAHLCQTMLEQAVDETPGETYQSQCVCGQWVTTVADAAHLATALLRQNEYDVILLDLTLTDTTGEETVKVIREAAPHVPIVVHTSISDSEDVRRFINEDVVQDYLVKGHLHTGLALRQHLCHVIDRWLTLRDILSCDASHSLAT